VQTAAITMPSELTVAHAWKDEKKPREYDFDAVFGEHHSQVNQDQDHVHAYSRNSL
jgi:6-phosphogluconolactonase (cycloisomerase 2 family)